MRIGDTHQRAQSLASHAALSRANGAERAALRLYGQAAALEEAALKEVPPGSGKALGHVALAAVTFLYKAGKPTEAERLILSVLADHPTVPTRQQVAMRSLLKVIREEAALREEARNPPGLEYSKDSEQVRASEAAAIIGISKQAISQLVLSGRINSERIGSRVYLSRRDVDAYKRKRDRRQSLPIYPPKRKSGEVGEPV